MEPADKPTRLSPIPFRAAFDGGSRKGLLRHGDAWFHFSQRGTTAKLRHLGEEGTEEPGTVTPLAELATYEGADFFPGWSTKDAVIGRDQILAGNPAEMPRRRPDGAVVPLTRLRHFYETLRVFGNHDVWEGLLASCLDRSTDLDALFASSYAHFSMYENVEQDFGDQHAKRDERLLASEERDLFANKLVCDLLEARAWTQDTDLAFEYVSRELSPIRTQRARFDDGRPARSSGAGGMDLLLRARDGGIPIIGEIKAKGDTNLFLALIQALTYACELATRPQRMRLARAPYNFPQAWVDAAGPYVDVFLIYETGTNDRIKAETIRLADTLMKPGTKVAAVIRRIAFLRAAERGHLATLTREHVTAS